MCGEKDVLLDGHLFHPGSPPHVRGKDDRQLILCVCLGITPACAGKSLWRWQHRQSDWDHPRMCGEKYCWTLIACLNWGSPPHVRGKVLFWFVMLPQYRITPACAGKSMRTSTTHFLPWDHPRMCGEKQKLKAMQTNAIGSPPHVRGKVSINALPIRAYGITPACAGKRLKRSRSTVPPVAIVPLFPSVCNKPVVSDGSPAGRDAPLFLPAENAVPASPAYNLRSL